MPHLGEKIGVVLALAGALCLGAPALSGDVDAAPAATTDALPARGEQSLVVVRVQQLLQAAGVHVRGGADGVYGPSTAAAVSEFQRARGLAATGAVDEATAIALGLIPPAPQLATGSHGDGVKAVQQQLIAAGLRVAGGADGVYGPATAKAVQQFQTSRALTPTGQVDALTAALLASGTKPAVPAAPATPAAENALPAPGSSGTAVRDMQRQLIAVGSRPKGGADGVYGPATIAAVKVFQHWIGHSTTGVLDRATADALAKAASGATAPAATLDAFPLPATCTFWDTWGAPRSGGRRHQGVDIFAEKGTPVYAVEAGRITKQRADFPGSLGGNQEWLTAKDGSKYFYGHLSAFAKGVGLGSPVNAGDVIGYVGATGLTTVTHLHFEIHPGGGSAVNPYPVLKSMAHC